VPVKTDIGFEPSSRNRTLDQLHKELREFERIDAVSDEMRAVIEAATAAASAPFSSGAWTSPR
jgi:hypothetical protein